MKKMQKLMLLIAVIVLAAGMTACGGPKNIPEGYDAYKDAIDIDFSKEIMTGVSKFGDDPATGNRAAGSPAGEKTANYIGEKMKEIGLENVTLDKVPTDGWIYKGANITFTDANGKEQKVTLGGYQTTLQTKNEKLPLVYLGEGKSSDFADVDVKGKLVLIDIDPDYGWWISYPAYLAKTKGAKAVVAVSIMDEKNPERINSRDIMSKADAPAFAISENDSKALQKAIKKEGKEEIQVVLNADSKVVKNTNSINVWGEIPGKSKETIFFLSHHDGYFHAFYDDAYGVGTILGMAKAFVDSGIKPEKTLRFISHSGEEWAIEGIEPDWAIGAYRQITQVRPEWAKEGFALVNIDSAYMLDGTKSVGISQPYEMDSFVQTMIDDFCAKDVKFTPDGGLPDTGREDFSYNAMGIPTIATEGGEGDDQFFASMYHSTEDTLEKGGFADDTFQTMNEFFGYTILTLDQMPLKPLNFEARFIALKDTLVPKLVNHSELDKALDAAMEKAKALDKQISELNQGEPSDPEGKNQDLYLAYKQMQDDLLRLNWWFENQFPHEGMQYNIQTMKKAIKALEKGDSEEALDEYLCEMDYAFNAVPYDKDVCDHFLNGMEANLKGTWAEGRIMSKICYADDVIRSILKKQEKKNKDFASEISQLNDLIKEQQKQLDQAVAGEVKAVEKATKTLEDVLQKWQE